MPDTPDPGRDLDNALWRGALDGIRSASSHLFVDVDAGTVQQFLPVDPPPARLPLEVLEDARRILDDPVGRQPSYGIRPPARPDAVDNAFSALRIEDLVGPHHAAALEADAGDGSILARALEPYPAPRSEALFGVVDELAPLGSDAYAALPQRLDAGARRYLAALDLARERILEPHADHLADVTIELTPPAQVGDRLESYRCGRCGITVTLEATPPQF